MGANGFTDCTTSLNTFLKNRVFQNDYKNYASPDEKRIQYLNIRGTPVRYAQPLHIWALGFGFMGGGLVSGWGTNVGQGGLGGLMVACVVVGLMYFCLIQTLSELASTLPFAGGMFSYSRAGLGHWAGFFVGLAENLQYLIVGIVCLVGTGGLFQVILNDTNVVRGTAVSLLLSFIVFYLIVFLHVYASQTIVWRFTVAIAVINFILIGVFLVMVVKYANFCANGVWNDDSSETLGGSAETICLQATSKIGSLLFPEGILGVLKCLPGGFWLFCGMECCVLAGEEVMIPSRTVSQGLRSTYWTVALYAIPTIIVTSIVPPGVLQMGIASFPFVSGLSIYNSSPAVTTSLTFIFYMPAQVCLFNAVIYAFSRQTFAVSRAGNFPKFWSITSRRLHRPIRCIVLLCTIVTVVSIPLQVVMYLYPTYPIFILIMDLTSIAAMTVYPFVSVCFIFLRRDLGHLDRPYRSRAGISGAIYVAILCPFTLITLAVLDEVFRNAVYTFLCLAAVGMGGYALLWRRMTLWFSLEEEFLKHKLEEQAIIDEEWKKAGLNPQVSEKNHWIKQIYYKIVDFFTSTKSASVSFPSIRFPKLPKRTPTFRVFKFEANSGPA